MGDYFLGVISGCHSYSYLSASSLISPVSYLIPSTFSGVETPFCSSLYCSPCFSSPFSLTDDSSLSLSTIRIQQSSGSSTIRISLLQLLYEEESKLTEWWQDEILGDLDTLEVSNIGGVEWGCMSGDPLYLCLGSCLPVLRDLQLSWDSKESVNLFNRLFINHNQITQPFHCPSHYIIYQQ